MAKKSDYLLKKNHRDTRLGELLRWLDENASALLDDHANGLEAIGVGKKNSSRVDSSDDDWCLVAFVEEKLSKKQVKSRNISLFADTAMSCDTGIYNGPPADYETDVVACGGMFRPLPGLRVPTAQRGAFGGPPPSVDLQKYFNALRTGIGITNPEGVYPSGLSVGTLGFFLEDKSGNLYLVSNNHVIANENNASVGDSIVQPGTLDLTQTELQQMNTIGKLRNQLEIGTLDAWVDIDLSAVNEVDVAIASLNGVRDETKLSRIGFGSEAVRFGKPYKLNANAEIEGDARVYKAGRTTGWTEGEVTAIGVNVNIRYSSGVAQFKNQIAITPSTDNTGPFSDRGDSGSGIWNTENELVALLYAGSPSRTLANPVDLVRTEITKALGQGTLKLVTV